MNRLGVIGFVLCWIYASASGNWRHNAWHLYEDLLNQYNRNVLPSKDTSSAVVVKFSSSLIRIIDLNEKLQEMTTKLWLEMQWTDPKLRWNITQYGGIKKIIVEAENIWLPDIILYDNSNGNPHVTILGNAVVHFDGTVVWQPPAIYKSFCDINIEYFPYDTQNCRMKFGAWSSDGAYLDILQEAPTKLIEYEDGTWVQYQEKGMDLTYYEISSEWDLLNLTNTRHVLPYSGCCGESALYIDIRFEFKLRRKALFFTVFFVLPCLMIASLTTFVFLLPSRSMKKMTMAITLFMALVVFLVALADLLPPNSVKIPLMAQYLLFTMSFLSVSIAVNVLVLNVHHRSNNTHAMSPGVQRLFLRLLPRMLRMKVPQWHDEEEPWWVQVKTGIRNSLALSDQVLGVVSGGAGGRRLPRRPSPYFVYRRMDPSEETHPTLHPLEARSLPDVAATARTGGLDLSTIRHMIAQVHFIADHFATKEDTAKCTEDWGYLALVIDRILLCFFTLANLIGMCYILLQAPTLWDYDQHLPIPERVRPLGRDTYTYSQNHHHHQNHIS